MRQQQQRRLLSLNSQDTDISKGPGQQSAGVAYAAIDLTVTCTRLRDTRRSELLQIRLQILLEKRLQIL